jgi:putative DNA primase/helicase
LTEIYGPRGVGKTMLAQSITEGIAYNTGFAPWTAGKQVPCLYFEGEMPTQDMIERLNMFGVEEGLFIYSDACASTLGLPKANLLNDEWQEQIREQLISLNVKFWVVDNLASLTPGADEISKKDYDPVNQFFLQLRFLGISTTFIHHSGKSGEQRGTSAKEDNVDTVIKLSYPPDYSQEDGCRFILTFEKARLRTKYLVHTKQLEFQFTENEHGKPIWTHKTVKAATKVRILQLLDEGISQKGVAEMLEVDPGYVSRVRKLAIEDKWMTKNNKITQTGYRMIFDEEN